MADADASRAGSPFPNTRWTLIEEVRGGGAGGERALAELCAIYWYPVYAYARRGGAAPPDAEDIAQGFFAHLLARGDLAGAEAARGRLLSFLLAALKHYIIDLHRKQSAQKRGGGATFIPIDAGDAEERYQEEPADLSDPEKLFERRWALALLDDAFARLEREYAASGKADLYHAIRPYLAGASKRHRYADAGAPGIVD